MQPDRWKQIEALFEAAQAQSPEKRAAFLAQACPDDPQLRTEVQSLLDQQADSFLEGAPLSAIKALSAGAKVGNFEIVELLGRGGMGATASPPIPRSTTPVRRNLPRFSPPQLRWEPEQPQLVVRQLLKGNY